MEFNNRDINVPNGRASDWLHVEHTRIVNTAFHFEGHVQSILVAPDLCETAQNDVICLP
jgi:hypothetical protein